MERSCNCCQESGEREASVSLFCPKAKVGERKFRKVSAKFYYCLFSYFTHIEISELILYPMLEVANNSEYLFL